MDHGKVEVKKRSTKALDFDQHCFHALRWLKNMANRKPQMAAIIGEAFKDPELIKTFLLSDRLYWRVWRMNLRSLLNALCHANDGFKQSLGNAN